MWWRTSSVPYQILGHLVSQPLPMASRRTIGTLFFRAAHGAIQEGQTASLDTARILCYGSIHGDGALCSDGACIANRIPSDEPTTSGASAISSGRAARNSPTAPLLGSRARQLHHTRTLSNTHSAVPAAAAAAVALPWSAAMSSLAPATAPATAVDKDVGEGGGGGAAAATTGTGDADIVDDNKNNSNSALTAATASDIAAAAAAAVAPNSSGDLSVASTAAATAPAPAVAPVVAAPAPAVDPALLSLRAQLSDSLAVCLGMQQLDALLQRQENREAVDEMLLLSALDVAYRLCASVSAAVPPAPTSTLALAAAAASQSRSKSKSSAEAASDVLTRLSELLIQRLSEPGALSAEGAVRALRTLAVLRFNPAGDYAGLQTMAAFYREAVLSQLDPTRPNMPPDLAARTPQLLADLFFAFAKLFDVAARREKDLQSQLLAGQVADEEAEAAREVNAASTTTSTTGNASVPPWERTAATAAAAAAEGLVVVGDRQLYGQLCKMLSAPGMLANVPSKVLGTLATAMSTARFTHFPLAQSIATQTLLRLQSTGLAEGGAAVAAAGVRMAEAQPVANDAVATSTLSNILSCLAKLGYEHEALCDAVANWMLQRLQGNSATASSAGGGNGSGGIGGAGGSRAGLGGGAAAAGIEPHHVVDVAVAFVRIKYENMDFLLRASEVLQLKLPQANPHCVSMMAWAIANSKCGRFPEFEGALSALAQRMVALHRYSTSTGSSGRSSTGKAPGGGGGGGGGPLAVLPRHLACLVFALAKLEHKHIRLMDVTASDVIARGDKYQARQLISVLRAFTLLNEYVPDMYDAACAVLTSRLRALAGQSAAALAAAPPSAEFVLTAQHYADAAWSVAMTGHAPRVPELMGLLAERVVEVAPQLGKASLVRAAQAYAVAGGNDTRDLMETLAQASRPLLVDLGPDYLSALVGAFAEGPHPVTEEFWTACMDAVGLKVPHLERPRRDMQLATWRLSEAFRRHPATQQYTSCRDHYVLPLLEALVDSQQQMLAQQ